jgi:LacI family transcriptional regulator
MRTTIKDVAREAGVSVATVSRVLNNSGPVRPETRLRIDAVARRLRYAPNGAAQSLSTRKTSVIGVLLPDLYGEFFSEVIRGIDRTAQQHGYHVLVSSSHNDRQQIEAALRAMHGRVDGLLVMSPDLDAQSLGGNLPARLPVVLLNCQVDGLAYDSVNIDNYGGAYAMTEHLVRLGHRRIAIIQGASKNHDARERLEGYRQALRDAGVAGSEDLEFDGDFSKQSGYRAAERMLRLEPRPTAVFASNDSMAIGALSALRQAGVSVPGDLAVAGFDDIPMARYANPPLSTVRVAIAELGAHAVALLLKGGALADGQERQQKVLPTTLVVRASTGESEGSVPSEGSSAHPFSSSSSSSTSMLES